MKQSLRMISLILLIAMALSVVLPGCAQTPEPTATEPVTEPATEEITQPPTEIPTQMPTEPPEDEDLVRVADFIPSIQELLIYATEENFTEVQIYDFYNAYLRYGTVKKLAAVCDELETLGLGILIWDGFRPVSAQAALWEICPDPRYVSNPVTGTRAHCRGNAVDLTLIDLETGERCLMPTDFDVFSDLADRDYSDCDPEAAANARLLETIMEKHGFKPYRAEWWHFTDTDSYPVEEEFEPPVG